MKIVKVIVFCVVSLFVCGCAKQNNCRTFDMTTHDFDRWDQLVSVEKYIVLEETDNSLLSGVDKCVIGDSAIYAFCRKFDKVYKFSLEGKFLSTVGEKGRAKSEYLGISDIAYDQSSGDLVVADSRGLLWYDSSLKFKKRMAMDDVALFDFSSEGDILFYGQDSKYSVTCLKNGKIAGVRDKTGYAFFSDVFYRNQEETMVVSDYGQFFIDRYKGGKLSRIYEFDMGQDALPENMRPQSGPEFEKVDDMEDYFKCLQRASETKTWLYTEFRGPHHCIYKGYINKKSGQVFFGKAPFDEAYGIVGTYQDQFYALLYPEYVGENSYMRKFVVDNGLQDVHNPVVIFLKLNEKL